jgi:hypothetical protein
MVRTSVLSVWRVAVTHRTHVSLRTSAPPSPDVTTRAQHCLLLLVCSLSDQRFHFILLYFSCLFLLSEWNTNKWICYFGNLHIFAFANSDEVAFCFGEYEWMTESQWVLLQQRDCVSKEINGRCQTNLLLPYCCGTKKQYELGQDYEKQIQISELKWAGGVLKSF